MTTLTTAKPRKVLRSYNQDQVRLIHRSYWLGIGWGLFALAMTWNYTATAQHNNAARMLQAAADQVKLEQMVCQGTLEARAELLPPPAKEAR